MSAKLKTTGNETTMNLNQILYQNIISSPYFKSLYDKKTYHEVVDEIYNNVTSLEPFLKGTHASTAFCLLYKLWTLKLTIKQIEGLIDNPDSPHIRAIGFLYLRYVCDYGQLWDWFGDYLEDDEEIRIEGGVRPRVVTIGKVCRDLLTESKWLGTILPRIPVPVMRDLEVKLKAIPVVGKSQPPPPPQRQSRSRSPGYNRDGGSDGGRMRRAGSDDLDYGDEPPRGGQVRGDRYRDDYDTRRRDSRDYDGNGRGRGGGFELGGRDGYFDHRRGRSRSPPNRPVASHRDDGPYRRRSPSPYNRRMDRPSYGGDRRYDDERRRDYDRESGRGTDRR